MILASSNGLLCVCKVVRETPKAWVVCYAGAIRKETRVPKSSGRRIFENVSDAERWIFTEGGK